MRTTRRPAASTVPSRTLPAWTVLLAMQGVGCEAPQCTTDRVGELDAHGSLAVEASVQGEGARALHELGLALGVSRHAPPARYAPAWSAAGTSLGVVTSARVRGEGPRVTPRGLRGL